MAATLKKISVHFEIYLNAKHKLGHKKMLLSFYVLRFKGNLNKNITIFVKYYQLLFLLLNAIHSFLISIREISIK